MPSLKAIRRRVASVKSTQKITSALKMVAGARLSRAQHRIVTFRPYALKTFEVLQSLVARSEIAESTEVMHPLLVRRVPKKVLLVVLTADRGLCGGFNSNTLKAAEREWRARRGQPDTSVEFI